MSICYKHLKNGIDRYNTGVIEVDFFEISSERDLLTVYRYWEQCVPDTHADGDK